jgi:type II secretory pathway component PulM
MDVINQVWAKLSPRAKWILTGIVIAALLVAYLMFKLHGMEVEADKMRLQLREALTQQKINVIQGDIKAESVKQQQNTALIDALGKQVDAHKADLSKQYQEKGLSSDQIVDRFKSLGLS